PYAGRAGEIPRLELGNTCDRMLGDASEHISKVRLRIDPVELGGTHERVDRCRTLATCVRAREQVVLAAKRNRSKRTLRGVVVDLDAPVVAIAQERRPARERIPDRSGKLRLLRQLPLCGD